MKIPVLFIMCVVMNIFLRGHSKEMVDYSETKVKAKCDLCADQWMFIISTGRSGSTSIFSMLNLIPGV
jgi:hypothetical protein